MASLGQSGPVREADLDRLLLDTAMALLVEKGIAGLDFRLVDGRAGVAPGVCRRHFGTPGRLIAALLESVARYFQSALGAIFERNPDDPVQAVIEWLALLLGPARDQTRAAWILLLDTGARQQVTMYAEALQAGWERQVATGLGSTVERVRVIWPMIEGWVGIMLIRDRPMPDSEVISGQVRMLLASLGVDAPGARRAPTATRTPA